MNVTTGGGLPDGLLGYLDDFEHQEAGGDDVLSFRGWILGIDSRVQSVVMKRKKGEAVPISYGLPRPDVAVAYPEEPSAVVAGFAGLVTLRRTAIERLLPEQIEICAVLESGQEVSCFSRSFPLTSPGAPVSGRVQLETFVRTVAQKTTAAYRDGRLSFSPLKWLRDLQYQYRVMAVEQRAARQRSQAAMPAALKQDVAGLHSLMLQSFLDSHTRLSWPQHAAPRVSIILILSNRAEMTFQCLYSLRALPLPVEIIVVDNASTNETSRLLERLDGVRILRQREKAEFPLACNEAARIATGKHVLLLNDAEILPGSLESAVQTLESADDIGAVGAKLVLPDGRLQEAGGIVWRDGSYRGYGRGDAPRFPAYMYSRDVDYCSAAFLLTPRELFLGIGGFDEFCRPAYYQDIDYCVRLWKSGKRVVFDPGAVVVHFEFANPMSEAQAEKAPVARRKLFVKHHADWIARKHAPSDTRLLDARAASSRGQRILVLDDRVPHFRLGAGFPRTCELIRTLDESGHFVTFYPMTMPFEDWSEVYDDIPRTVEVMVGLGVARLHDFLKERDGYYDRIIISRPHNMKTFRARMWRDGGWATRARVIYDAEAIFAFREAEQRRLVGEQVTEDEVARLLSEEMGLAHGAHAVFSVTDRERDCFLSSGVGTVWTLGHTVEINPTPRSFEERAGFLFVGAMGGIPNRDAVLWFAREIWPTVRSLVGGEVSFSVVGAEPPAEIHALPDVNVLGQVADLTSLYDRSRIFVAPSRLAAGVPIKVQTAAAHGLPVICTSILADELGWRDGVELLVADGPEEFAKCCARLYSDADLWQRLRAHALERVARECSKQTFAATLAQALA